jgi:uncharacterized damage-inducible protein DinB
VKSEDRPEPPHGAGEKETLTGFLDFHRATLLWKCSGLSDEQVKRRAAAPSTLSLLGLVRHLTDVERGWFRRGVGGETRDTAGPIYYSDDDPEGDIEFAPDADAAADVAAYEAEVERCRAAVAGAGSLDDTIDREGHTVRWVLVHMVEEYARHNGHADILREQIDGATGE